MHAVCRLSLLAPAVIALAACSSTEPNAMHPISVSAAIGSPGARAAAPRINADLIVGGSAESVRITSARMVLSRLKLATTDTCASDSDEGPDDAIPMSSADSSKDSTDVDDGEHDGDNHDGDHDGHNDENNADDDCPPVHAGPVLINLPLDGTTTVVLDAFVPAGTYTALKGKLDAVDSGDAGSADFLAAHPDFAGVSVKVVGAFKGTSGAEQPFTFTSHMKAVTKMRFDSPVTVGSGTMNLTIDVDVSSWFTDASGGVIDPTNPANQHAIEKNIRASLHAFKDNNHDGEDDHDEGGH